MMLKKLLRLPVGSGGPLRPEVAAVDEAFWIILGREADAENLRDLSRGGAAPDMAALVTRLLSSPEFRIVHDAWRAGGETGRDLEVEERGLCALGSDEEFVGRAYELLLGRPADADGLRHAVTAIGAGERRTDVLRALGTSEEFAQRYHAVSPDGGFVPRDTQLCELANPAKWSNPDWMAVLRDLQVLSDHPLSMHRKSYEYTQLVYGMRRLGFLRDDARVLSVGAGHECILYWLANHVGSVVATDMYEGVWQSIGAREGDEGVLRAPVDYAPFPYRNDHLTFLKMDGLHLSFRDGAFDVVYSLSSIEHFGGLPAAQDAVAEMARVLAPGGLLVLATEYVIAGPPHAETFMPADVERLLQHPQLRLVEPIDEDVYRRHEYVAVDLYGNRFQTPHMVVRWNDTVFTTVMAFLEKVDA